MNNNICEIMIAKLKSSNCDAFLIVSEMNRFWYTGFASTAGWLLVTHEQTTLYLDGRYYEAGSQKAQNVDRVVQVPTNYSNIYKFITEECHQTACMSLGYEGDYITVFEAAKMQTICQKVTPISFHDLRATKQPFEVAQIKKACSITEQAITETIQHIQPGMSEIQLRNMLEHRCLELGADKMSFDTIIASGTRGALPHGIASMKIINSFELITIDMGVYYQGYASDITRTIALGDVNDKLREIYNLVAKAQQAGIEAIKPGINSQAIDAVCRNIIQAEGYGRYFQHSTGHGLGIDVHEFPRVSPYADTLLKPGMVITVEPGIYISGLGGVRIEDDILVTTDGYEILSRHDDDLHDSLKIIAVKNES